MTGNFTINTYKRIFIAASGSGGHLIPALHIARALKELSSDVEIEFIGAGRPLEKQLVEPLYPLHVVAAARVMQQGPIGLIKFLFTIPKAIAQLRQLFKECKPSVVVGVGGYASVIPVGYATWCGIPTLIHEAERKPGLANRVLAPFASVVSVAREACKILGATHVLVAGQPMRAGLSSVAIAESSPKSLLVMGGSQGAAALDAAAAVIAPILKKYNLAVMHQTRKDGVAAVRAAYEAAGVLDAEVVSFISDMNAVYARSDLIVSRAGANTVSEIEVVGRPTIFVPYPHAQADHQSENAQFLAKQRRAIICPEGVGFAERLAALLETILANSEGAKLESGFPSYQEMLRAPASTRNESAAGALAHKIIELASG